jgi:hypothetical protein
MTAAQVATARRMHGEGRSVREIAAALGVPRSTAGRAVKCSSLGTRPVDSLQTVTGRRRTPSDPSECP